MSEQESKGGAQHEIRISQRAEITVSDVKGVLSFDEEEIVLDTGLGRLTVEGEGLRVTVLSLESGEVSAVGVVNGVFYQNDTAGRRAGFLRRKG